MDVAWWLEQGVGEEAVGSVGASDYYSAIIAMKLTWERSKKTTQCGIRLCGDGVDIAVETAGRLGGSICGEVDELTLHFGAFVIARVHAVRDVGRRLSTPSTSRVPLPLAPCRIESLRTRTQPTTQSHVLSFSIPTSQPSKISFLDLDEAGTRQ